MNADITYRALIKAVIATGCELVTRNHSVISTFNLPNTTFTSTPLVTYRKTAWRKALLEMQWFLSGRNECPEELKDWWSGQLNADGKLLAGYPKQFRHSSFDDGYFEVDFFDQVNFIQKELVNHPNSRRLIIDLWNPGEMADITGINDNPNTPTVCHSVLIQFFVRFGRLHMKTYQRSADMLLGVPHNWIQSWALLMYFAHHAGLEMGSMTWMLGDAHIYKEDSHFEAAGQIIGSLPRDCPNLIYTPTSTEFLASDFSLDGVVPEPQVLIRPRLL